MAEGEPEMGGYKKAKNPTKPKFDWNAIREDYIVQNLDQEREKPYTVVALAKQWGVSRKQVDVHIAKEDWRGELRRRAKVIADARIDAHTDGIAETHREIRERHVAISRGLISLASKKYNEMVDKNEELSAEQMLKFLAFALPQEREALGLPRYLQIQTVTPGDPERAGETPSVRMARRAIERKIDKDLAKAYAGLADAAE